MSAFFLFSHDCEALFSSVLEELVVHRVIITISETRTQDELYSLGLGREIFIEPEVLWRETKEDTGRGPKGNVL